MEAAAREVQTAQREAVERRVAGVCSSLLAEFEMVRKELGDGVSAPLDVRSHSLQRVQPLVAHFEFMAQFCVPEGIDGAPRVDLFTTAFDISDLNVAAAAREIAEWADWHVAALRDAKRAGWTEKARIRPPFDKKR